MATIDGILNFSVFSFRPLVDIFYCLQDVNLLVRIGILIAPRQSLGGSLQIKSRWLLNIHAVNIRMSRGNEGLQFGAWGNSLNPNDLLRMPVYYLKLKA